VRAKRSGPRSRGINGLGELDGMLDRLDEMLGELDTWDRSHDEEAGVKLRQRLSGVSYVMLKCGCSANNLAQLRDLVRIAQRVGYRRGAIETHEQLYAQFLGVSGLDDPEDRS